MMVADLDACLRTQARAQSRVSEQGSQLSSEVWGIAGRKKQAGLPVGIRPAA